jgi:hypothetical protein
MNRAQFTTILCDLLQDMRAEGLRPFIDFVKRSDQEQKRLFLQNLSKCDGIIKVSQHQRGKAADIYLLDDQDKLLPWTMDLASAWHRHWEDMGGEPMIPWDIGHFEVK